MIQPCLVLPRRPGFAPPSAGDVTLSHLDVRGDNYPATGGQLWRALYPHCLQAWIRDTKAQCYRETIRLRPWNRSNSSRKPPLTPIFISIRPVPSINPATMIRVYLNSLNPQSFFCIQPTSNYYYDYKPERQCEFWHGCDWFAWLRAYTIVDEKEKKLRCCRTSIYSSRGDYTGFGKTSRNWTESNTMLRIFCLQKQLR